MSGIPSPIILTHYKLRKVEGKNRMKQKNIVLGLLFLLAPGSAQAKTEPKKEYPVIFSSQDFEQPHDYAKSFFGLLTLGTMANFVYQVSYNSEHASWKHMAAMLISFFATCFTLSPYDYKIFTNQYLREDVDDLLKKYKQKNGIRFRDTFANKFHYTDLAEKELFCLINPPDPKKHYTLAVNTFIKLKQDADEEKNKRLTAAHCRFNASIPLYKKLYYYITNQEVELPLAQEVTLQVELERRLTGLGLSTQLERFKAIPFYHKSLDHEAQPLLTILAQDLCPHILPYCYKPATITDIDVNDLQPLLDAYDKQVQNEVAFARQEYKKQKKHGTENTIHA